jgi:hypothetical protein
MENAATLIAHVDSGKVTYQQLKDYIPPPSTRHWKPVSHLELVDSLKEVLAQRNIEVAREEFAVSHNGLKLFGVMDFKGDLVPGVGKSMGFRHANDKSIRLQGVAGGRVFVCDNMSLAGSMTILSHKHTWGFNLVREINNGFGGYERDMDRFASGITKASETLITDERAKSILAKSLFDGTITHQIFKSAYDLFFEKAPRQPEAFQDCAPRTVFGLHNALTRALKLSSPNVAFNSTIELSRELGVWQ